MIDRASRILWFGILSLVVLTGSRILPAKDIYTFGNGKVLTETMNESGVPQLFFDGRIILLDHAVTDVVKKPGMPYTLINTAKGYYFIHEEYGSWKKIVQAKLNAGAVFDLDNVKMLPGSLEGEIRFSANAEKPLKTEVKLMAVSLVNRARGEKSVAFLSSSGQIKVPAMQFIDISLLDTYFDQTIKQVHILPFPEAQEVFTLNLVDGEHFTGSVRSANDFDQFPEFKPKGAKPAAGAVKSVMPPVLSKYIDENGRMIDNIDEWMKTRFTFLKNKNLNEAEIKAIMDDPLVRNLRIGLEGGSVVVLGESGSGKTETVERFLSVMAEGKFPELSKDKLVIKADAQSLGAGTKYVGTFEARLKNLIEYAQEKNAIILMDEIHSLRGSGTSSNKPVDVFQQLKSALSEKKIKVIATDTTHEFYAHFGGDEALIGRLMPVMKEEPAGDDLLKIVKSVILQNSRKMPDEAVLKRAIQYSYDLAGTGAQPRRVLGLINFMYNAMKIDGFKGVPTIKTLEKAVVEHYKVDAAFVNPQMRQELLVNLKHRMNSDLIGMDSFKATLEDLTYQRYTGLSDPEKPAIRVFIAGPRGAGKTEGALVYSKVMKQKVTRIEMNQFAYAAPKDFLAKVAQALQVNSHATIILDEFEKASGAVQNAALALLDSGRFVVDENVAGSSHRVSVKWDARGATIMATSNAGSDGVSEMFVRISKEVMDEGLSLQEESKRIYQLMDEGLSSQAFEAALIEAGISAPLLDRFQTVLPAYPATRQVFTHVLELHFDKLITDAEKRSGVLIEITNRPEFIKKTVESLYYPGVSNRYALRILKDVVRSQAARQVFTFKKTVGKPVVKFALDLSLIVPSLACKQALQTTEPNWSERTRIGFKFGANK